MSFSTYAHTIHRLLRRDHPDLPIQLGQVERLLSATLGHNPIKLGQVQQVLAAALGHNSLASYQNTLPPENLGQQIIVDWNRLIKRCNELGLPNGLAEEFVGYFKKTATQIVYGHEYEYVKALMDFVRDAIPQLREVQSHLGHIGARISFSEVDPINFPAPLGIPGPILHVVSGTVELSTLEGRPHPSRKLFFDGSVAVEVFGRRCLGAFSLSGGLHNDDDQVFEYGYLPNDD
jgi:hypothetical protein